MGFISYANDFVRGLLMGAAEIVPGVSGGTIALIVGVYERLVAALSQATTAVLQLLRGDVSGFVNGVRAIDWRLLVPLLLGMICVLLVGARFIPDILEAYPVESRGLFFGLIAGSLVIPWRRIAEPGLGAAALAGSAAVAAFFLAGLPPGEIADPSYGYVFLAAAIAICALVLPGVSGAYFLLIFGIYEASLSAVRTFELAYVAAFLGGAALGLGVFARLLTALLSRHYDATMAVLVGLMLGSLRALWPWLGEDRALVLPGGDDPLAPVVVLALIGAAGVLTVYGLSLSLSDGDAPGEDQSANREASAPSDP